MKLYHSPNSPYVRKVRVVAHERNLHNRFELVEATPRNVIKLVSQDNPLAQIPTLVLRDGTTLYDLPVICEFLDSLDGGPPLIPTAGAERWQALRLQALGDAMIDQAIAVYSDTGRPEGQRSKPLTRRRTDRLKRCLDTLESSVAELEQALTIGPISVACALGYIDFSLEPDFWRPNHPTLAKWFDHFAERPSMRSTPHPPPRAA